MRKGDWIETYSSRMCYPLDPRPEEICIEDIAHALSLICRFNGHCSFFYSVGQHSLGVQEELAKAGHSPRVQLYGLLHDASEAYLCDLTRPVKPHIEGYEEAEALLQDMVFHTFGLPPMDEIVSTCVTKYDNMLLRAEAEQLMPNSNGWAKSLPECNRSIEYKNPEWVKAKFLDKFNDLCSQICGPFVNESLTISGLLKSAHGNAVDKGFWDKPQPVAVYLALIHSEVSEALEADRKGDRENFAEEIADVFIRLGDLCGGLELDIETTIKAKMEKNRNRPKMHGKAY